MATAVKPRIESGRIRMASAAIFISILLDLLAQILRRASNHQPGDEDREDGEDQQAVEAGADAAEDDLAELRC